MISCPAARREIGELDEQLCLLDVSTGNVARCVVYESMERPKGHTANSDAELEAQQSMKDGGITTPVYITTEYVAWTA